MRKGLFITVNYKKTIDTIALLHCISKINGNQDLDVIIIDNVSSDKTINDLTQLKKDLDGVLSIQIIESTNNLGYFGAAAYALSMITTKYSYYIIANNDLIIKDVDFLLKTKEVLNEADIIAPRIISMINNTDQNPFRENKVSFLQKLKFNTYFSSYWIAYIMVKLHNYRGKKYHRQPSLIKRYIYGAHGACMIFNTSYFDKGGYIDNNFLLYGEEDSITGITQKIQAKILYDSQLIVYHNEHQSTGSNTLNRNLYRIQKETHNYIKRTYDIY